MTSDPSYLMYVISCNYTPPDECLRTKIGFLIDFTSPQPLPSPAITMTKKPSAVKQPCELMLILQSSRPTLNGYGL